MALALFLYIFGITEARSQGTPGTNVMVAVSGSGTLIGTFNYGNGRIDTITNQIGVNLQFHTHLPQAQGYYYASTVADFTGTITINGTGVETAPGVNYTSGFYNTLNYDEPGYAVATEFFGPQFSTGNGSSLSGDVAALNLTPPTAGGTPPIPTQLSYNGTNGTLTLWINLPSPFGGDTTGWPIPCSAIVANNGSSFQGTVVDAATGNAISGATVVIGTQTLTTGSDGSFFVPLIPPGPLTVQITATGYAEYQATEVLEPFSAVQATFELNAPTVTLSGSVNCTCDGSPIAGAQIDIGNGYYFATSARDGSYSIPNIPSGTYPVDIFCLDYFTTNTSVTIPSGVSTFATSLMLTPSGYTLDTLNEVVSGTSLSVHKDNNVGTPGSPVLVQSDDGNILFATFTPGQQLTIAQAACKLGYDHFNWLNMASANSYKTVKYDCSPSDTKSFFFDPPHTLCDGSIYCIPSGVNTCENADISDLYYNEGSAYPGICNITNQISPSGTILRFSDQPSVLPLDLANFLTCLAGVKADGSYDIINNTSFAWTSDYNGLWGGVDIIAASLFYLTNANGGIVIVQTNVIPADMPTQAILLLSQNAVQFAVRIQPSYQTLVSGANVTLSVFPTNASASFTYQWRFNGTNISGATNVTLQLLTVTTNSSGNYDVVLSNTNGILASAVATLTVLNAPMFQAPTVTSNSVFLSWAAAQGKVYQLQYTTNLIQPTWVNIGNAITASNTVLSATNTFGSDKQRFYRVQQQ